MSYRGILKPFREQLLSTGLSESTVEVCVLRVRHRTWSQGRLAMKLGFSEVDRFVKWDAEQWFGIWTPGS